MLAHMILIIVRRAFSLEPILTEFTPGDKYNVILVMGFHSPPRVLASELLSKENILSLQVVEYHPLIILHETLPVMPGA